MSRTPQCTDACRWRASVSSPHICRSEQVERIVFMCGDCFATRIDSSPLSKSQIDAIRRHEREDQAEELTATPEVPQRHRPSASVRPRLRSRGGYDAAQRPMRPALAR